MKILWHMPTLRTAMCGLSIRAVRMASELIARGHQVTFAVAREKTDVSGGAIAGIPVVPLPVGSTEPLHWSMQARARRRTARALIANLPLDHDLLISCQPEAVAAYGERVPDRPLVFVCGGTTILHDEADRARSLQVGLRHRLSFSIDRRMKRANERTAFESADAIVFDSESTCRRVIAAYRLPFRKCHPIHGGVDPVHFHPPMADERTATRQRLGIAPRELIAVWTGRISAEKNLEVLIDAMARCRRGPDRLCIVGDGSEGDALRRRAESLDLGDRIKFVGSRDDVRPYLFAADMFVFPSISESFGGSLAEAMACGLPCIALRADETTIRNASEEILEHGRCGLLVEHNAPESLAAALDQLAGSLETRRELGERAACRALSCFTWRRAGERLDRLVRTVVDSKRASGMKVTRSADQPEPEGAAIRD